MARQKTAASQSHARRPRSEAQRFNVEAERIPTIFKEILADVATHDPDLFENDYRPTKRRRLGDEESAPVSKRGSSVKSDLFEDSDAPAVQEQRVVLDDYEGSEEGSEDDFEDVDLEHPTATEANDAELHQHDLQLDLSKPFTTPTRALPRRKPVTPAERAHRLAVHKTHLLCWVAHVQSRNHWCNSEVVQSVLKPIVTRKTINLLHVDDDKPQYQRSHSFNRGIEEVCALWKGLWQITMQGIRRAYWRDSDEVDLEKESEQAEDTELEDFIDAARTKQGSRDLGAQLFCALLRSLAVDTRLVCSVQVLPFSGVAKGQTPEKPKPAYIYASTPTKKKRIVDSPYPVWWVEVFSPAISTWIPLDPLVRNTINKPRTGFEPPASDHLNKMSYVMAFEEDETAKDVTRRYTQWYNAKTIKTRVESTKHGGEWYKRALSVYYKHYVEARDEIEDAEFLRKAEKEPMPSNVQDFKGHPFYVLESQLRQNEVIWPKKESGKFGRNVRGEKVLESVYRRNLVRVCRSADAWYRKGRDVRGGEAPLKRGVRRGGRRERTPDEMDGEVEDESVPLYADFQTEVYVPPPVKQAKVPKNAYGNLDVYVPGMIPAGAVHVKHPLAAKAAKVLGTDYADAVTGFDFKGRQGTAVVNGVVVPSYMTAAIAAVIEGLEAQSSGEIQAQRSRIILGLWKRWLTALRIRDKVEQEYGGKDDDQHDSDAEDGDDDEDDETYRDNDGDGGGFIPDPDEAGGLVGQDTPLPPMPDLPAMLPEEVVHYPIVIVRSPHKLSEEQDMDHMAQNVHGRDDNDDLFDDVEESGGFVRDAEPEADQEPGGFMVDDDEPAYQPPAEPLSNAGPDEYQEPGGFTLDDDERPQYATPVKPTNAKWAFSEKSLGKVEQDDLGGGFIVEEDGQEDEHGGVIVREHGIEQDNPPAAETPISNLEANTVPKLGSGRDMEDKDDLEDIASLFSHDPEEDELDPDWLVDNLDET